MQTIRYELDSAGIDNQMVIERGHAGQLIVALAQKISELAQTHRLTGYATTWQQELGRLLRRYFYRGLQLLLAGAVAGAVLLLLRRRARSGWMLYGCYLLLTKLGRGDVRITTRYRSDYLADGLFSTLHEAGHAMYEQGIADALDGTPLFRGTTSGVHESQSRLWENLVGRSLPFWQHWYAPLQAAFPDALKGTDLATFYRAINKVSPSLVRTRADEVTYNLHVMLRFDLELELLEGTLAVADLPDAWRARIQSDLGITPPDDRDGVLQDVHWYGGVVGGAFQSYTLGNIMSAQFFAAARRELTDLDRQIGAGEFEPLRQWLTGRI